MSGLRRPGGWLACLIVLVALVVAPMLVSDYFRSFLLIMLMYLALALSWNMMSGYTGYLSFGHGVFFGIGAYTFAMLVSVYHCPFPLAILGAGISPAIAAFLLGLVFMKVRIRTAYFAIATLGLNEIVKAIVAGTDWLGSSHGMTLPPPPSSWLLYDFMLAIAAATLAASAWIDRSSFGLGLKAILQDEEAAEATGVPTFRCKLLVFVISAVFPGLTGAIIGWHWSYIDPYMAFDLTISFDMSVMALFGGIGTLWGPVIGSVGMGSLGEVLWAHFPNLHALLYGLLIAVMVVLAPGGIIQIAHRLRRRLSPLMPKMAPTSARST